MITGRRSTDWLREDAAPKAEGDRRADDRRSADRRAPRRRFDPLFMATLVNQVATTETIITNGYAPPAATARRGVMVNFRA